MKTIREIYDTLSDSQKEEVYLIIGYIMRYPEDEKINNINFDFLSNEDQVKAIKAIIEQAKDGSILDKRAREERDR